MGLAYIGKIIIYSDDKMLSKIIIAVVICWDTVTSVESLASPR